MRGRPSSMPVAVLAGGLATRLRPLTETVPKSMVEVAGRPFVFWQMEMLASRGVREVVLCLGHLGEQVERAVGDGSAFGASVRYSYDGSALLGTAGALRKALPLLGDGFMVTYGDSYLDCDYGSFAEEFVRRALPGLMAVYRDGGRNERSNAVCEGGMVRLYDKRCPTPEMRHVDWGLMAFRASVFASGPGAACADLSEVCAALSRSGELAASEMSEPFFEIGKPEGLRRTEERLLARLGGRPPAAG